MVQVYSKFTRWQLPLEQGALGSGTCGEGAHSPRQSHLEYLGSSLYHINFVQS